MPTTDTKANEGRRAVTPLCVCLQCRTLTPAVRWLYPEPDGTVLSRCPYCEARGEGIAVARLDQEILEISGSDLKALGYARIVVAGSHTAQAHAQGRAAVSALDRIIAKWRR